MMKETIEKQHVEQRVISFLKENTNFTLATSAYNIPYCANCFYAYAEDKNMLIFKSRIETIHIKQALENRNVAGSITPDRLDPAKIRGIQFRGNFTEPGIELLKLFRMIYYKKFPFAVSFAGDIWAIELTYIKMTDNTLGFGKKIEWSARTPSEKK